MPVYDKPMIYYPTSTLMLADIKGILIITTPEDAPSSHRLLDDGSRYGVNLGFAMQHEPNGLTRAFIIGTDFVGDTPAGPVLDSNIFYGLGVRTRLRRHVDPDSGAIFACHISDLRSCGVVESDGNFTAASIREKPAEPKSNFAVPGLYFCDSDIIYVTKELRPPTRGEYEITDVNRVYLEIDKLQVEVLPRGITWFDTGTFDSLADATGFVCAVEAHRGLKIGAPEEVVQGIGLLADDKLHQHTEPLVRSGCRAYLLSLLDRQADVP